MPRGQAAKPGDKTTNANGYEYTRTADRGWVGTHILVMEEKLKRQLRPGEYVQFVKDHRKRPITIDMLELRRRGDFRSKSLARIAQIEARIAELQAEKELLEKDLANTTSSE